MSQENVESFKRALDAGNRWDLEALCEELDPAVEWQPLLPVLLGGEATVYRGHAGVRELFGDIDQAFTEFRVEISELRDLDDDRIVAIGGMRGRGRGSGAVTESPLAYVVQFRNAKAIRIRSDLDPEQALEAVGLRE